MRLSQLLFQEGPQLLERHGRDAILEERELLGEGSRKQIGAGREDLTELDVRRAQLFEGDAKLLGAVVLPLDQWQSEPSALQADPGEEIERFENVVEPVSN